MSAAHFQFVLCCLLWLGPACLGQGVTVRVINGGDGRPLARQQVTIALFYEKGERTPAKHESGLSGETGANGEAEFRLPEAVPAHIAVEAHLDPARWHCGCHLLVSTKEVLQTGMLESAAGPGKSSAGIIPVPGEVIFVARPLSFLERLMYPLLKG